MIFSDGAGCCTSISPEKLNQPGRQNPGHTQQTVRIQHKNYHKNQKSWLSARHDQRLDPHCASLHLMSDRCTAANQGSLSVKKQSRNSHVGPLASFCAHVRLLLAPPGLAGLEDDSSLSAALLLFLFSASFVAPAPPPPAVAPPSLVPFSLSRSLSLSRLLLVRSGILMEELLPEMRHGEQTLWINTVGVIPSAPQGPD